MSSCTSRLWFHNTFIDVVDVSADNGSRRRGRSWSGPRDTDFDAFVEAGEEQMYVAALSEKLARMAGLKETLAHFKEDGLATLSGSSMALAKDAPSCRPQQEEPTPTNSTVSPAADGSGASAGRWPEEAGHSPEAQRGTTSGSFSSVMGVAWNEQQRTSTFGSDEAEGPPQAQRGTTSGSFSSVMGPAEAAWNEQQRTSTFGSDGAESPAQGMSPVATPATGAGALTFEAGTCGINTGSVGHPELCNRPCLRAASGTCEFGSSCEYCHMAHPRRPVHLDKKHREMLRMSLPQEWLPAMLGAIRQRVNAVTDAVATRKLWGEIAVTCTALAAAATSSSAGSLPPRGRRSLQLTLRAMSLKTLLTTLARCMLLHELQVGPMCDKMLQHLRSMAEQPRCLVRI